MYLSDSLFFRVANFFVCETEEKPISRAVNLFLHAHKFNLVRVNSKKPPHLCGKFTKPPLFGKIAKNHLFCENLLQYALIVELNPFNMISDK
jgi:hypothetical protein